MLVSRLQLYLFDLQRDWDQYVHPLTYVYNRQTHRSSNTTPFSFPLFQKHPGPITIDSSSTLPNDAYKATIAKMLCIQFLEKLATMKRKSQPAQKNSNDAIRDFLIPKYEVDQNTKENNSYM